jgi:hypothetical protein
MTNLLLPTIGGVVLLGVMVTVWLLIARKRQVRGTGDPEVMQREAARRAIEELSKAHRTKKRTIRGQGGGGDERTAQDAAYGTDFDGAV